MARALSQRLREQGRSMAFSVSYTTRSARPGEQDGVDYHFVSDAQFEQMIEADSFLEQAGVFGKRYGTGREATEKLLREHDWVVLDIDWQGARQVRQKWPQVLSVFIAPPSIEELRRRLIKRGQDDSATIEKRMQAAEAEMSHAEEFDAQVVNEDLGLALKELEELLR